MGTFSARKLRSGVARCDLNSEAQSAAGIKLPMCSIGSRGCRFDDVISQRRDTVAGNIATINAEARLAN